MTDHCRATREQSRKHSHLTKEQLCDKDRCRALGDIEDHYDRAELFAEHQRGVGRAEIFRSRFAKIYLFNF